MKCGRKLLGAMVLTAAILPLGARASWAHDHAPDPTMLLNLDLFASGSGTDSGSGSDRPSMLDQIRTLQAMGYLSGANPPAPQPMYANPIAPQPMYASPPQPPTDSEDDIRE